MMRGFVKRVLNSPHCYYVVVCRFVHSLMVFVCQKIKGLLTYLLTYSAANMHVSDLLGRKSDEKTDRGERRVMNDNGRVEAMCPFLNSCRRQYA